MTDTFWRVEYKWDDGVSDPDDWIGYGTTTGEEATKVVLTEMRGATSYAWRAVRIETTQTVEAW